uniref:Uncharacterized protein n=1 Tax=Rhizophora mucronata TaxID=61149 RepID=A0A2P2QMA1_RHIMU
MVQYLRSLVSWVLCSTYVYIMDNGQF